MANIKITELQPISSNIDNELEQVVGGLSLIGICPPPKLTIPIPIHPLPIHPYPPYL